MRTVSHLLSATVVVLWFLRAAGVLAAAPAPTPDDLYREARELKAKYAAEIEKLAVVCDNQGMATEAQKTRGVLGRNDPYKLYLPVLPRQVGPPKASEKGPALIAQWHARFLKLRQGHAAALYDVARRAVRKRQSSLAYQLVLDAIRADPDHEGARRVLGYQEYEGQWRTAYEVRKLEAGMVWHKKFGWIKEEYVERYEQGERYSGGHWNTAEADAKQHRDIRNGWDVETEHYRIRTNHSIEAAVALGVKLETLYRLWQQIFIRYYATDATIDALFAGRAAPKPPGTRPFDVVYFRNREEFKQNQNLQKWVPNISVADGLYLAQNRTAYFFPAEEDADRVLYHEATHQLFQQSRRVSNDVGRRANFWIIEGIAMYMESLHQEDGYYVLGGLDDVRMNSARYHVFKEDFYVPFGTLTTLGMEQLQTQPKLAKLYSQMAAMTSFLVYYDNARYRDALVTYLTAVYSGRDDPDLLAQLTGTSYAELDTQYREYMKIGVKDE
jgi:hypothetical protein